MALPQPPADSAGGVDDHLVSLVAPATFEAEQYRALRHIVEQLHKAHGLRVVTRVGQMLQRRRGGKR